MKVTDRFALVASLALLLVACGGSQKSLERHHFAAQTLEDIAREARAAILERHAVEIETAAAEAKAKGLDPGQAARGASAAFREGPALHWVNAFIAAKQAYVNALVLMSAEDDLSARDLMSKDAKLILRNALDAYESLRKALGKDGDALPEIPVLVKKLLL